MNTTTPAIHPALGPVHVEMRWGAPRGLRAFAAALESADGTVLGQASGYFERTPLTPSAAQRLLLEMESIDLDHAFCASNALIEFGSRDSNTKKGRPDGFLYVRQVEIDSARRGLGLGHLLLAYVLREAATRTQGPILAAGRAAGVQGTALPDQGAIDAIVAQSPLYDTGDRDSGGIHAWVDCEIAAAAVASAAARVSGSPIVLTPSLMADCIVASLEVMGEAPLVDVYIQNETLAALSDQTTPLRLRHVALDDGRLVEGDRNVRRQGQRHALWRLASNPGPPASDSDPWSDTTRPSGPKAKP